MRKEIYTYKTRVKYIDVDAMGFVHNSRYLVYFEDARIELVRDNNYPYSKIEQEGIIIPISEAKLEYKKPLKYDEEIAIDVNLEYVKNMSIKFIYTIKNSENNTACLGYTVHAFLDMKTLDFVEIPENLKEIFKRYLK